MNKQQAFKRVGGLSRPSKMPGYGWGISANLCNVGSKLRKVEGSVCAQCYALKGHYMYPNVQKAHKCRLDIWKANKQGDWSVWMATAIKKSGTKAFRWFDSGDLQSIEMLDDICHVAIYTPLVNHYLPTKERKIVNDFIKNDGIIPDNLVIRISSSMVDRISTNTSYHPNVKSSNVTTDFELVTCPAPWQGNKCGDCRKCWDKDVDSIVYKVH